MRKESKLYTEKNTIQSNLEKEKQLLNACKADKEKFADLYNYFLPDMYRCAYSLANNVQDAADLVSQAFTEFYKKLDSFVWQGVSIKYWLFRTVRNLWNIHARRSELTGYSDDILNDRDMEISFVEKMITEDLLQQVQQEIQKWSDGDTCLLLDFPDKSTVRFFSELNLSSGETYPAFDLVRYEDAL